MDFIRKNWSRLSLAFLYFLGGVLAIVAWANYGSRITDGTWLSDFYNIALLVSTMLFFFGMVGVTVVKTMQSKKVVSALYMIVGGIITLLLIVFVIVDGVNGGEFTALDGLWARASFYQLWVPFFIFGLHPLIKGVTRFIEAEMVPAQVKPAAAPVAETVVAEKKPAAKKAAPKKAAK
ncbi:MAG: hypothetical protein KIG16_02920 [Eubacteriales bacterium]|nr:hypothetical protein [Eubacteriales bacterium]